MNGARVRAPVWRALAGATPVASSAALGPRERKFRFRRADEIIMIAGARDRPHRGGVELAVLDEIVVDINADHLSEHDVTLGHVAAEIRQAHGLQPFAFEGAMRI